MKSKILKTSLNLNYNFLRLTLDYKEDLVTIKKIYDYFHPDIFFSWKKVVNLYKKKPSLFKANNKI